jgi:tetratricopeptide (TPR) repeat protein
MKFYNLAVASHNANKLHEALDMYSRSIHEEELESSELLNALNSTLKISKTINQKIERRLGLRMAKDFEELSEYKKAIGLWRILWRESHCLSDLHNIFRLELLGGNLNAAKEAAKEMFVVIAKGKHSPWAHDLHDELSPLYGDEFIEVKFFAWSCEGNVKAFEGWMDTKERHLETKEESFLTGVLNADFSQWSTSNNTLKAYLAHTLERGRRDIHLVRDQEITLLKAIFTLLIDSETKDFALEQLKGFSNVFQDSEFINALELYSEGGLPRGGTQIHSDFGGDLLSGKDETIVNGFERKIATLIKIGKKAEAIELAKELRKLDPENLILNQLAIGKSPISETLNSTDELLKTLAEIRVYSGVEKTADIRIEGRVLVFQIKSLPEEVFTANYGDLYCMLMSMNYYEEAAEIISFFLDLCPNVNESTQINARYLRVLALMKGLEIEKAINEIETVLDSFPLNQEERVCYLYTKAELLFNIKQKAEALRIYRFIEKERANYRLTRTRIHTLEQN